MKNLMPLFAIALSTVVLSMHSPLAQAAEYTKFGDCVPSNLKSLKEKGTKNIEAVPGELSIFVPGIFFRGKTTLITYKDQFDTLRAFDAPVQKSTLEDGTEIITLQIGTAQFIFPTKFIPQDEHFSLQMLNYGGIPSVTYDCVKVLSGN